MFNRPFSLVHFVFHVMILRRFDPLSCSLKRVHASMNMLFLMNKTKDQISWVSSHDLYWENKMYKRKRSISCAHVRFEKIKYKSQLFIASSAVNLGLIFHWLDLLMDFYCRNQCRIRKEIFNWLHWNVTWLFGMMRKNELQYILFSI